LLARHNPLGKEKFRSAETVAFSNPGEAFTSTSGKAGGASDAGRSEGHRAFGNRRVQTIDCVVAELLARPGDGLSVDQPILRFR
jgi:hypothetical protein